MYLAFAAPNITYVSPTPSNNTYASSNWLFINATIDEPQNQTILGLNGQNYTIYEPSLVLNLPFEENSGTAFYDNSPYGNNGTCTGSSCPAQAGGKFGKALQFDGVDDYVLVVLNSE